MAAQGVADPELTREGGGGKAAGRSPPARRPSWTQEEDELLSDFVRQNGLGEWAAAAQRLPGRTKKQCRNRWYNALASASKKAPWTEEEESKLTQLHSQYGEKWTTVAKHMPNRTRSELKNHWSRMKCCKSDAFPPGPSVLHEYGLEINGETIISIVPASLGGSPKPADEASPITSPGGHKPGTLPTERPSGLLLPGSSRDLPWLSDQRFGTLGSNRSSNPGAKQGAKKATTSPVTDVISPRGSKSAGLARGGKTCSPVPSEVSVFLAADVTVPSKRFPLDPLPRLGGPRLGPFSPPNTASETSPRSASQALSQNLSPLGGHLSTGEASGGSASPRSGGERPETSTGPFDWVTEWVALSNRDGIAGREKFPGGISRPNASDRGAVMREGLSNNRLASFSESANPIRLPGPSKNGPVCSLPGAFRLDFSGAQASRPGHQTAHSEPIETVPLGRTGFLGAPLRRQASVPVPWAQIAPPLRRYASVDLPSVANSIEVPTISGLSGFTLSELTISGEARKRKPRSWVDGDEKRVRAAGGPNRAVPKGADAHREGPEIEHPVAETLQAIRELYGHDSRGHIALYRDTEEPIHTPSANSGPGFAGGNQLPTGQGFASPGYAQSPEERGFMSYKGTQPGPGYPGGVNYRAEIGDAPEVLRGGISLLPHGGECSGDGATARLTTLVTEHLNVLLETQCLQLEKAGGDQPVEMSPEDLHGLHQAHIQMKAAVRFLSSLTGADPPTTGMGPRMGPTGGGNRMKRGSPTDPGDNRSYSDCSPGGAGNAQGTRHVAQCEPHVGGRYRAEFALELGDATDSLRGASWEREAIETQRSDCGGVFKGRFREEGWGPLDVNYSDAAPHGSRGQ